ncbi:MAG: hypothetical protein LQ345_004480 [Seirophora villosa]|nr:MAG: hypothetical protein LQ345_004480 [Seirophora villosa]
MSKPANIFAGGWSADKADRFKKIQLPDKSRCKICRKLKPINAYSNKQQLDLKQRIAGPQGERAKLPTAEIITCRPCTGGPVHELTCCICNKTQGLDAFNKTQRKTPDAARCILCVHEMGQEKWAHLEWQGEESEEDDSDEDFDSRSVTNPYDGASYQGDGLLSAPLKALSLTSHSNVPGQSAATKSCASGSDLLQSYDDEELTSANAAKGKGKETASDWQKFAGGSRGKAAKEFIGYDNNGRAHPQVRNPSTIASEESVEFVTDGFRGRSGVSQKKGRNSRFARVPRGPSPPLPKGHMVEKLKATRPGHTVSYSDEDTSEEEWP